MMSWVELKSGWHSYKADDCKHSFFLVYGRFSVVDTLVKDFPRISGCYICLDIKIPYGSMIIPQGGWFLSTKRVLRKCSVL